MYRSAPLCFSNTNFKNSKTKHRLEAIYVFFSFDKRKCRSHCSTWNACKYSPVECSRIQLWYSWTVLLSLPPADAQSQPLRGTELAFKLLIHIYAQQIAGIASLCDFHVWLINQAAENALIKPRD